MKMEEYETIYTYTYGPKHETNWFLIFCGITVLLMSLYFYHKARQITAMKKRCTKKVTAVITAVRKGQPPDDPLRYRYGRTNASYRYECNGTVYNSSNNIYGIQRGSKRLKEGDIVQLFIDPDSPATIFDGLASSARSSFLTTAFLLTFTGLFLMFAQFVIR